MQHENTRSMGHLKRRHKIFLSVFILILIFLITDFIRGGLVHSIVFSDVSKLSSLIGGLGIIGPIAFILLVTIEVMIAPIPGFIFYVTGAVLFGWFWGGVITITGNMIGASLAFYLAKYLGRDYVKRKIKEKKLEQFDHYTERFGGYAIFFLRINPLTSSDIFSYLSGFSRMKYRGFFLGTFFGLLPLSFIQTYFGKSIIGTVPVLYWVFILISILYFLGTAAFIYYQTE